MKLAIIDYGAGNLRSVVKAFNYIGEDCVVTSDRDTIHSCSGIVLPGVGAFREAVNKLEAKGLVDILKKEANDGKALFGICLGMQLLFEQSYEFGQTDGLGFIKGSVEKIDTLWNFALSIIAFDGSISRQTITAGGEKLNIESITIRCASAPNLPR